MTSKFFQLLRFSIDESQPAPEGITAADWPILFRMAKEQNLQGVIFHGINRLPKECLPEKEMTMRWFALSRQIAKLNIKVNVNAAKVSETSDAKDSAPACLKDRETPCSTPTRTCARRAT